VQERSYTTPVDFSKVATDGGLLGEIAAFKTSKQTPRIYSNLPAPAPGSSPRSNGRTSGPSQPRHGTAAGKKSVSSKFTSRNLANPATGSASHVACVQPQIGFSSAFLSNIQSTPIGHGAVENSTAFTPPRGGTTTACRSKTPCVRRKPAAERCLGSDTNSTAFLHLPPLLLCCHCGVIPHRTTTNFQRP
jgi:hypothetical protein